MDGKHFPKDPKELWESPEKVREMQEKSLLAEMQALKKQKDMEEFVKGARKKAAETHPMVKRKKR